MFNRVSNMKAYTDKVLNFLREVVRFTPEILRGILAIIKVIKQR